MKKISVFFLIVLAGMTSIVFANMPHGLIMPFEVRIWKCVNMIEALTLLLLFLEYHYSTSRKSWIYRTIIGILIVIELVVAFPLGDYGVMSLIWKSIKSVLYLIIFVIVIYHIIRGIKQFQKNPELDEEKIKKLKKLAKYILIAVLVEIVVWFGMTVFYLFK